MLVICKSVMVSISQCLHLSIGMNKEELTENQRLDEFHVHDLNSNPR